MDWVKAHLALNHVAVVGTPFLLWFLVWAWRRGGTEAVRSSLWWILVFAAVSIALKFTGDFAAEQAGAKFDGARVFVNAHEEAADQATAGVFLMGLAAGTGLWFGRGGRRVSAGILAAVLVCGLATCVLLARAAHLGGRITHVELR